MAGLFTAHMGGDGWSCDWEGDRVIALLIEASKRGIDEITELSALAAKHEHTWETRTGQTEEAVFWKAAEVEWVGTTPESTPHVWGEWGVEDRPRFDQDGNLEEVSTKDVAMFLEFGTEAGERKPPFTTDPMPWLYPVWDEMKLMLPDAIARHYRELSAIGDVGISSRVGWRRYMAGF